METIEKVISILSEQLGMDEYEINGNSDFVNDLGMDSLDTVEIIMAVEKAFNLTIQDNEVEGIRTVNDLVKKIEEKLAQ